MNHVYSDIKNKEDRNTSLLLTIMSEPEESNKVNEEIKDSHDNDDNNQPILQKLSSLLISMISNQEPLMFGTTIKLGLILTEDGARLSVLTSYFKVNGCGKCKLEN